MSFCMWVQTQFTIYVPAQCNSSVRTDVHPYVPITGFCSRCQHPRLERSRREGGDYRRECVGTIWLIEYGQCLLSFGDNSAGESSLFMLVLNPQWVAGPTGQTPISSWIWRSTPKPVSSVTSSYSSARASWFSHEHRRLTTVSHISSFRSFVSHTMHKWRHNGEVCDSACLIIVATQCI
jgi:hypothetical protein